MQVPVITNDNIITHGLLRIPAVILIYLSSRKVAVFSLFLAANCEFGHSVAKSDEKRSGFARIVMTLSIITFSFSSAFAKSYSIKFFPA